MKRFSILTAEIEHETNTFCVIPTTIDNFRQYQYITDPAKIENDRRKTRTSLGATFEAADLFEWNLTPSICAVANPTGKVTDETFECLCTTLLNPCLVQNFDGILLHLHGAMVSDSFEDADGEILRRVREVVGPIPIIVTLDLHGNITPLMAFCATSLIAVRTYPHVDYYDRAWQAAKLLHSCLLGEVHPVTVIAKRPQLKGLDGGKTFPGSPMQRLIDKAEVLEKKGDVLVISICAGFTGADIFEIGPSVTVTVDVGPVVTEESKKTAEIQAKVIANEFMDFVWETRAFVSEQSLSIPQAMQRAGEDQARFPLSFDAEGLGSWKGPLVIADVSDNPGSGHYGDSTNVLAAMIASGLQEALLYAIFDPAAVLEGVAIGIGNFGTITLGGRVDPLCGGGPLTLTGQVVTLSCGQFRAYGPMGGGVWQNLGLSMLFRVGGVDVVVISNNAQILDLAQITSLGIDPLYKQTVVVKSKQHFRASVGKLAREIIAVDGGGLGAVVTAGGNYTCVRRPIWPLDSFDEI